MLIKQINNKTKKNDRISKLSLICYFGFVILSIFGRFVFPSGDEPDYFVRLSGVLLSSDSISIFHPYYYLSNLLKNIPLEPKCQIYTSPLQLSTYISGNECINDLSIIINRIIITFISSLIFILPTVFRKFFFNVFSSIDKKIDLNNYNFRCDVISITVLLPSSIYYLGLVSSEQFVYCIILASFLVYDSWLIILFFLWAMVADFGNSIVFISFITFFAIGRVFYKKYALLTTFIYLLSTLIFAYIVGSGALLIVGRFFPYLLAIFNDYQEYYSFVYEKYPVILRPIVTFMTFSFMTSQSIKPLIIIYIIFTIIFALNIKMAWSFLNKKTKQVIYGTIKNEQLIFYTLGYLIAIFFIISLILIVPGYGNYKYYLFFSPFFTAMTINSYQKLNKSNRKYKIHIVFLFTSLSLTVFLSLFSFYIENW